MFPAVLIVSIIFKGLKKWKNFQFYRQLLIKHKLNIKYKHHLNSLTLGQTSPAALVQDNRR